MWLFFFRPHYHPVPIHSLAGRYVYVCVFTNLIFGISRGQFVNGSLQATIYKSPMSVSRWLV